MGVSGKIAETIRIVFIQVGWCLAWWIPGPKSLKGNFAVKDERLRMEVREPGCGGEQRKRI